MGAAGLLLMTPRMRHLKGPALRGGPLPVTATLLSLVSHAVLAAGIFVAATQWSARQPKMYIVNLVPAVAAVGSPQGQPALPPRAEEPPARPAPRPSELPERSRPAATAPPEMPARTPSLPDRALPDRTLPPRAPGAPRPSEKELPQVASTTPAPPAPSMTTPSPRVADTPPPAPLGQRAGSPQGAGAVTVNTSDFPFAWYIGAVQRKINERWDQWAQPGRQPVAVFVIGRDGRITGLAIEKTSGNPYYDQKALRAISDALPFPPLPAEYRDPVLTIHLEFNFSQDRG